MKKIILLLLLSGSLAAQTKTKTTAKTVPKTLAQNQIMSKVLIPYRDKNLWGLSDTLGRIVVKPFAKDIKQFAISDDGKFISRYVVKTNKKYYVIDRSKTVLLPEINTYDSITVSKYHPDHFFVYKKGKLGLFTKGKELIPCLYESIELSYNQSFEVTKDELVGVINSQGKLIIPTQYTRVSRSWDDEDDKNPKFVWNAKGILVEKKFYDTKIKEKPSGIYGDVVVEDIPSIKEMGDGGENDVNKKIDAVLKELNARYDRVVLDKRNAIAGVEIKKKWGVYDFESKEEIIAPLYDEAYQFASDKDKRVFKVALNGKYGLVKEGNIEMTNIEYDEIEYDNQNSIYILVKDNKKGMIIFNTIYPIVPPKYVSIKNAEPIRISDRWQFGLFKVTTEKGTGYLGENGVEFFKD